MSETRTTCPYCGVGCGVIARVEPSGTVTVRGDENHPANFGRLCVKGAALGETTSLSGRLLHPEVDGRAVGWPQALAEAGSRLRDIIERYGPQAVAFYASGQLLTEDYYAANKLMKGFIGAANIDTNSRLCMSSAVTGYKRALGADVVPCSYEDVEQSDLVVLVGSNAAWRIRFSISGWRRRNAIIRGCGSWWWIRDAPRPAILPTIIWRWRPVAMAGYLSAC